MRRGLLLHLEPLDGPAGELQVQTRGPNLQEPRGPPSDGRLADTGLLFLKTKVESFPTLQSISKISGDAEARAKLDRNYYRVTDVEMEEAILAPDRVKAFAYGKQLVPVSAADLAALKYASGERTLEVLCATPETNIQRHLVLGGTECVAAEPRNGGAARALSALALAAKEDKLILVAKYVWRKNAAPKLVMLTPDPESSSFFLNSLPFFEDIRPLKFPPLPRPTTEQLDAVEKLIDSMSLMTDEGTELVRPADWHNPSLQRFYRFVMGRALGRDDDEAIQVVDAQLASLLEVPPPVRVRSEGPLKRLKETFPLEPAANKRRQRVFWRDNLKEKEAI
eukprot:Polyplicarium_translucidae@DN3266_c0_g1_i7.p1